MLQSNGKMFALLLASKKDKSKCKRIYCDSSLWVFLKLLKNSVAFNNKYGVVVYQGIDVGIELFTRYRRTVVWNKKNINCCSTLCIEVGIYKCHFFCFEVLTYTSDKAFLFSSKRKLFCKVYNVGIYKSIHFFVIVKRFGNELIHKRRVHTVLVGRAP